MTDPAARIHEETATRAARPADPATADDPASPPPAPWARWERRLVEAFDHLWDHLVDPREAYEDELGVPWPEVGGLRGGPAAWGAPFRSEAEHRAIRAECRALAATNEFAINGHENRVSYIVGTGHVYRAAPHKRAPAAAPLAADVQRVLDEFLRENDWFRRQQETALRRDRDGEAFLRLFLGPDGVTRVRHVEPGQVATPAEWQHDPSASFGILTEPDDVETVRAYFIDGAAIEARQVQHRKAHVDANVKRGLPLFYPVRKNLRRAEKLLRNMSTVAEIQSAIALIRKHQGAARTAVQQFVAEQADAAEIEPRTGRVTSLWRYPPGTILDAYGNVDYDFPAAGLNAASYVTVLQAELRAVASRLVMPEFMLTSDASNANYASTLVAEGPAVKMFQRLQEQQKHDDLAVLWRVVDNAVASGRLPREARTDVEIQVGLPSVAVRDLASEAHVARLEYQSGLLSLQTWSQRRGLDFDQEQANRRALRADGAGGAT